MLVSPPTTHAGARGCAHADGGWRQVVTGASSAIGATLRAKRVLAEAAMGTPGDLVRAADTVNEVWFTGDLVLRITPNRSSDRLHHEAAVANLLPAAVRYPEIVATGRSEVGEWMITRRVRGQMLSRAWPTMRFGERADAIQQLGEALRTIHRVTPPPTFRPPFLDIGSLECPHQLPAGRVLDLIDRARNLAFMPPGLLDRCATLVRETMDALDPPGTWSTLIHGDLHLGNVLWDGSLVSAVLDFEWARVGPPDLDLDVMLRFLDDPAAHVDEADRAHINRSDVAGIPGQLREVYPELFSNPRLGDRLRLYALSYDIRALLLEPLRQPPEHLHHDHPVNRIRRLLAGRDHLALL